MSAQPEELTRQYLDRIKIMQLATSADDQPWVVTVHYYSDQDFNLYWVSTLARKHSGDIEHNQKVAATILVHENTSDEPYVIGVSITGTAELLGEQVDASIGEGFVRKLDRAPNFLPDIASGKNPHKFYRLKPSKIVLFDNKNFPDDPRQEWEPGT